MLARSRCFSGPTLPVVNKVKPAVSCFCKMVLLHVKRGDESQFLFNTTVDAPLETVIQQITAIYNGRLKVDRICSEIPELADHGITLPPNMQGLTEEQIVELKLKDEWEDKCVPSGGAVFRKDEIGRRNGHAPNEKMKEMLMRTVEEAKALISKKQVQANVCVTMEMVKEALDPLRGAVMIVYPMGLPPHDPIRMEFEDCEDLAGTQASLQVITEDECQLWWAAKEMQRGKKLQDYIGKNEKTKLVVKIQKKGQGAPAREPLVTDEQQKQMMMHMYKRQEELKKLEEADDDSYLESEWTDRQSLRRQFQGLTNIKWGPR
ncbi:cilia- and flagella-associated protein 298 isoform X2 [Etheostoma spectabile]|uniref:cilia- and flagella-associated protein 298 isoform X2 n=1 Tax=Etheostoma spectabile TaxID=54343 RepID=UPI0013AF6AA1|nr:cilia- and flagella-associated protein 298 isoform X2 [Etheostoma spectabile]